MTLSLANESTAFHSITRAVTSLYERHPYPKYPLLARPRWVDGYLTTSLFSHRLTEDLTGESCDLRGVAGSTNREMQVLVGGSGEILPYIIRQWEPWRHRLICVDLSKTSLQRARIRLALNRKPIQWVTGDLDFFLEKSLPKARSGSFGHIDAFGVLHHMLSPGRTLDLIASALVPGGTARIMIYNSDARQWIHEFQRIFRILKINASHSADIRFARDLIIQSTKWSDTLATLVGQMGAQTLANPARFADTFLHPRECTLDCTWWLDRIAQAGLKVSGLLDRYAELDDLPNPLWRSPSGEDLKVRAQDGRFEGNLEIYVRRPGGVSGHQGGSTSQTLARLQYAHALRYGPPRFWFGFRETKDLPLSIRWGLWHAHLVSVLFPTTKQHQRTSMLQKIPLAAQQRLARIGAIFPSQIPSKAQRETLITPMTREMEIPTRPPTTAPIPEELFSRMTKRLEDQGRFSERRMGTIVDRLRRAALISREKA